MEKLKCFLYILMRDYVVCGAIGCVMEDNIEVVSKKIKKTKYSNKGLAMYAEEVAKKLLEKGE